MKNFNNKNPLISIIMPVYNACDFIVDAINSVRKQTYENWELIAVDDGSTVNSLILLKKLAKKDKRIKVFHLKKIMDWVMRQIMQLLNQKESF